MLFIKAVAASERFVVTKAMSLISIRGALYIGMLLKCNRRWLEINLLLESKENKLLRMTEWP